MKDFNYITVSGWMVNVLKLKGNELLAFALIYGFCQDGNSKFTGSLNYVMEWLNCSKPTAIKSLGGLVGKGLIIKENFNHNGVSFNNYLINLQGVKKLYLASKETLPDGSKETLPYINTFNNTNYNNRGAGKTTALFPEFDKDLETLFRNSMVGNEVAFKQQFLSAEYDNIDIDYYFNAVADWNETKKVVRTAEGWLATARGFMRRDHADNKLRTLKGKAKILSQEQIDYLNQ